jgi:glycosyltransferase involved in cell wall biosynthesis
MTVPTSPPTVALLPWGNVFEDFLDTIGVSLETFCQEMTGGWLFGYVEALQMAGVRAVIFIVSARVSVPTHLKHLPTGTTIWVLPASKSYRTVQHLIVSLRRQIRKQSVNHSRNARVLQFLLRLLENALPYLSTPLRDLTRELRAEGCESILCQEYEHPRFDLCVLLGLLTGLPVFASFQGGVEERSRLDRFIRSWIVQASAGLIIAPQSEVQRVQAHYHVPLTKIAQIFNPLDLRKWAIIDRNQVRSALQIPLEAWVVVWHGRISIQHKGLDLLLEAWERLCHDHPKQDLRLLLVGTGQDELEFQQRLAAKQLPGIHWINKYLHDRAEIRRLLSAGDVYAFASRYEGFPVAPLEAMACGLPVVATDVQGIPDIFEAGEASGGIIIPRENTAELADALGRLLDDEIWHRELGRRARCRVEAGFSLETVGKQLRSFLFPL